MSKYVTYHKLTLGEVYELHPEIKDQLMSQGWTDLNMEVLKNKNNMSINSSDTTYKIKIDGKIIPLAIINRRKNKLILTGRKLNNENNSSS